MRQVAELCADSDGSHGEQHQTHHHHECVHNKFLASLTKDTRYGVREQMWVRFECDTDGLFIYSDVHPESRIAHWRRFMGF